MAKNKYADMNADELEDLAKEQERRNAALKQLARTDFKGALAAVPLDERNKFLAEREKERRDALHAAYDAARERFTRSKFESALSNPGRYSAAEYKAAIKWLDDREQARRFDATNETARVESENKKLGMIGQGSDAAEAHAEAEKEKAKTEWGAKTTIAEQQAAAQKYLAAQQTAAQKYGIDAEHGVIGADGKVTPGSRERTAKIQGESEVKKQEEANKGLAAQAEIQRQQKEKDLAAQLEKARIAAGGKADAAKSSQHAKIISSAISAGALTGKDVSTVLAELKGQYKDDPEMQASIQAISGEQQQQPPTQIQKGTEKTFPNGEVGVWDGTKWVKKS